MQRTPQNGFSLAYEPLDPEDPARGSIAMIPWDSETFGFTVAQFRPGTRLPGDALFCWARRTGAELIAAITPAADRERAALLSTAGFRFVDFALLGHRGLARDVRVPSLGLELRRAEAADLPVLERIARTAFRAGRYHMDPRFPEALAGRRYARWIANALARGEEVYVFGSPGEPHCFCHMVRGGDRVDLPLVAVEKEAQGGIYGAQLIAESLKVAKAAGARQVFVRISAANLPALNLYAGLGFRFSEPEAVFHWHAPGAAHLLPGTPL
jgi:GNAT superfamily N-acetyltransferase